MIRFYWRPLIPGELDPEFLWGSVFAASGFVASCWLFIGLPLPSCPLHVWTGIPCPTCGMTRGFRSLLHGNLEAAFLFNPLVMVTFFGIALYVLYAAIVVIGNLPRLRWEALSPRAPFFLRMILLLLVAGNWVYLILRERNFFPSG